MSWIVLGCGAALVFALGLMYLWRVEAKMSLLDMQEWEEKYFLSTFRDDKKAEDRQSLP